MSEHYISFEDLFNKSPEQDLIDIFVEKFKLDPDPIYRIDNLINKSCKSKKYADVEYVSASGVHWVIEAKGSKAVHNLFGELLKETGRTHRSDYQGALLIPYSLVDYYVAHFRKIERSSFLNFGISNKMTNVFAVDQATDLIATWEGIYDFRRLRFTP